MDLEHAASEAIVVGVDGSTDSDRAVIWGVEQAALEGRRLLVVHGGMRSAGYLRHCDVRDATRRSLDASTAERDLVHQTHQLARRRRPTVRVDHYLTDMPSRRALLAASPSANLIVVGSRGRGNVRSSLLGSVSVNIAKRAGCPVVVTRPHRPGKWKSGVLVGADGSADSHQVIEFAFQMASLRRLPLTVMHSTLHADTPASPTSLNPDAHSSELHRMLAQSVAGFAERFPDVYVTRRIAHGLPEDQLRGGLHPWSLIVVGRRQHKSWRLGQRSVATSILERYAGVIAVVPKTPQAL